MKTLIIENWETLLAFAGSIVFVITAIIVIVRGGRRSRKVWLKGIEKEGSHDWVKLSLTRKKEGLLTEGWAKSEWGRCFVRSETVIIETGQLVNIRKPCVTVVNSFLTWRSALWQGDPEATRMQETFEGVSLEQEEDGTWKIVPSESEIRIHRIMTP